MEAITEELNKQLIELKVIISEDWNWEYRGLEQ